MMSFYCRALKVTGQAFYDYLERKDLPWKLRSLYQKCLKYTIRANTINAMAERMYMSLLNKKKAGDINIHIPCEGTIRNVTDKIGLIHKPHRKPNRITKADRESQKTDDLPKRV